MVPPGEPVTIKRYGNRRLYQPGSARYVTLSELQGHVSDGVVATGADITELVPSPHPLSPRRTEH